jgi:hypothetical protein
MAITKEGTDLFQENHINLGSIRFSNGRPILFTPFPGVSFTYRLLSDVMEFIKAMSEDRDLEMAK